MRILRIVWFRLRALLQRDAVNAELDDELRFHVERETAENVKRGMNADEARRTALAQFGGVERFKGVLLRPLPYPDAAGIVALPEKREPLLSWNWSAGQYAFTTWQQAAPGRNVGRSPRNAAQVHGLAGP